MSCTSDRPARGIFLSGKFDQYRRDIPYATLAQAFRTFIRQILSESEAEVDRWRNAIRKSVGPNGQLIVSLIPELEFVIGKQPPVAALPPRKPRAVSHGVPVLSGCVRPQGAPLAIFLDDLQWLDAATLKLLEHLVTHPDVRHLLLIGAFRDNEVSTSHPLMQTLDAIRGTEAVVREIALAPLSLDDVTHSSLTRCIVSTRVPSLLPGSCTTKRWVIHFSRSIPHGAG